MSCLYVEFTLASIPHWDSEVWFHAHPIGGSRLLPSNIYILGGDTGCAFTSPKRINDPVGSPVGTSLRKGL
jgi:hypothetical protein